MSARKRLPMLMIQTNPAREGMRDLFNVSDGRVYNLSLPVPFNRCLGSSHGWLICIDNTTCVINLYNPFHFGKPEGTITLPVFNEARDFFEIMNGQDISPDYYICKAVLSANLTDSGDYTVMLIYSESRRLAYYKSGSDAWVHDTEGIYDPFYDLAYFHGAFWAIDFWGVLHLLDIEGNGFKYMAVSEMMTPVGAYFRKYIVLSTDGETIYQVYRGVNYPMYLDDSEGYIDGDNEEGLYFDTNSFSVFKLVYVFDKWEWHEISTIGDEALFVGDSHSYCVKASDFPGVMPDCIYFTEDYHDYHARYHMPPQTIGPTDHGMYSMEDGTVSRLVAPQGQSLNPPAIWILSAA